MLPQPLSTPEKSISSIPETSDLPHGFQMSSDGASAIRKFSLEVEGKTQNYSFTIYFDPRVSKRSKINYLQQFTPEMIEKFGKESVALGLGKKFSSLTFSSDSKGNINKLDMMRINGKIKTLDNDYFQKKLTEIQQLSDDDPTLKTQKMTKFQAKYKMFETMQKISFTPLVNIPGTSRQKKKKSASKQEKSTEKLQLDFLKSTEPDFLNTLLPKADL